MVLKLIVKNICNLCKPYLINNKKLVNKFARQVKSELKDVGFRNLPKNIPIRLVKSRKDLKKLSKIRHLNLSGYTKYEYETINGQIIKKSYNIYILSNLHQTEFKSVLAHEFLHVYLFENNYNLSPEIREGFCNLGSELIYKNENSKYSILKLEAMKNNPDPVYGLGFKKMSKLLNQSGWNILLRNLSTLIKNLNQINDFLNEVRILSKLNHPNILRYYNCWFDFNTPFRNISRLQYFINNHFKAIPNINEKNIKRQFYKKYRCN